MGNDPRGAGEPVTVRDARIEDIDRIIGLWVELMDYHRALDAWYERAADGEQHFGQWIETSIAAANGIVLVAERGGRIIGYVLAAVRPRLPVFAASEVGEIMDLAVTAGARGSGAGTSLEQAVCTRMRELGAVRVEASIAAGNASGRAFWQARGFEPFMERRARSLLDEGEPSA
jgi:GNAT superfamily N-acetyltransferase